jgi:hypothetical protein
LARAVKRCGLGTNISGKYAKSSLFSDWRGGQEMEKDDKKKIYLTTYSTKAG